MTASTNPENITGHVSSNFGHCATFIFPYGSKTESLLLKCGLFHQGPFNLPVQNVQRGLKVTKNEEF